MKCLIAFLAGTALGYGLCEWWQRKLDADAMFEDIENYGFEDATNFSAW